MFIAGSPSDLNGLNLLQKQKHLALAAEPAITPYPQVPSGTVEDNDRQDQDAKVEIPEPPPLVPRRCEVQMSPFQLTACKLALTTLCVVQLWETECACSPCEPTHLSGDRSSPCQILTGLTLGILNPQPNTSRNWQYGDLNKNKKEQIWC